MYRCHISARLSSRHVRYAASNNSSVKLGLEHDSMFRATIVRITLAQQSNGMKSLEVYKERTMGCIEDLSTLSYTFNATGRQSEQDPGQVTLTVGMLVQLRFFDSQDEVWHHHVRTLS